MYTNEHLSKLNNQQGLVQFNNQYREEGGCPMITQQSAGIFVGQQDHTQCVSVTGSKLCHAQYSLIKTQQSAGI
eukprot:1071586-Ditylum_brightwellii.AAC.1